MTVSLSFNLTKVNSFLCLGKLMTKYQVLAPVNTGALHLMFFCLNILDLCVCVSVGGGGVV